MDESIDTDDLIDLAAEYIAYLRIERGSSPRTIEAYEADLETYRDFLSSQGIEKLSQVSRESIGSRRAMPPRRCAEERRW